MLASASQLQKSSWPVWLPWELEATYLHFNLINFVIIFIIKGDFSSVKAISSTLNFWLLVERIFFFFQKAIYIHMDSATVAGNGPDNCVFLVSIKRRVFGCKADVPMSSGQTLRLKLAEFGLDIR